MLSLNQRSAGRCPSWMVPQVRARLLRANLGKRLQRSNDFWVAQFQRCGSRTILKAAHAAEVTDL